MIDRWEAEAILSLHPERVAPREWATVTQIRDLLVARGLATPAEIDEHLANVAGGALDLATSPLITAWGRTPRCSGSGTERHEIRESPV